jgi:hypothetical protein
MAESKGDRRMSDDFFEEKKSRINALLTKALGFAATPYLIGVSGRRPFQRSGLNLAPEEIGFVEKDHTP